MDKADWFRVLIIALAASLIGMGIFAYQWWNVREHLKEQTRALDALSSQSVPGVEARDTQTETTVSDIKIEEKGICFDDYRDTLYEIAPAMNTTEWMQLDTGIAGFAFRYPDTVSVSENEISAKTDFHKASITTYKLREEYAAPYIHASSVFYEPPSNTWWKYPSIYVRGQNPSDAKECVPNEIAHTSTGEFSIYLTVDGDVGVSVYTYFVVMRDVVQSDNYEPLIVEFKTIVDGNSSSAATFGDFQDILENIIRTVEVRPTSKG